MAEAIAPDRLSGALTRFGFSDREAVLYLASLRRGRATARELTREARIDRVLGYRLLDGMRARGLLEITAERPRRYTAVPAPLVLERHLRERRTALESDEELARRLIAELAAATAPAAGGAARYQLLAGPGHIYDYLGEMADRAHRTIEVMLTFRSMRDSLDHGLGSRLAKFMAAGGSFRLILESDPRLPPTLARFRRTTRRFPRVEIREMAPQPSRLTIVDGREALLFLVPEARDAGADPVAVWTDHPGFIEGNGPSSTGPGARPLPPSPGSPGAGRPEAERRPTHAARARPHGAVTGHRPNRPTGGASSPPPVPAGLQSRRSPPGR